MLFSVKPVFATQVYCECIKNDCAAVSFELTNEPEGKVYIKADFLDSSIEGYAVIRRFNNKAVYSLGKMTLIEDYKKGFEYPGTDRKCSVIEN